MNDFWLCFVPIFIAVDPIGVIPMFLALTEGIPIHKVHRIIWQSVLTSVAVAIVFLAIGSSVLKILGIQIADFMIAGGILLFFFSMGDLYASEKAQRKFDPDTLGAVPLGVPLIAGPALLTTSIILMNEYGFIFTAVSIILNILLIGVIFWFAESINKILGDAGAKILSKIASLLLAAIAVMIVRKGIFYFIQSGVAAGLQSIDFRLCFTRHV
ncbi:MAG: MarC family protein [Desulfobacterales bacterium]|nr:MarC family protein [Desulfobacterales bacterium]MDD4072595.1 MarC family protein [Desulfobacterales bacterium]MDD4391981.1 MarC family protein [Desulfobacterales bacterium]